MDKVPTRIDSFKTGLGDVDSATTRHVERYNGIRKNKREKALNKIRYREEPKQNALQLYNEAKQNYNRLAYLNGGDMTALVYLSQILTHAPDDVFEEIIPNLIKPLNDFVSKLVSEFMSNNPNRAYAAMTCLSYLVTVDTSYKLKVVNAILITRFANVAIAHFEGKTDLRKKLWLLIERMVLTCKEARDVVLTTAIFVNKTPIPEGQFKKTPFLIALEDPSQSEDMCALLCAIFDMNHYSLPPAPFVVVVWTYAIKILQQVIPEPTKEEDEETDPRIKWVLSTLMSIASNIDDDHLFSKLIVSASANFLRFMVRLIPRVVVNNKLRIMDFLVMVSTLQIESSPFVKVMTEAGCAPIMIQLLGHPQGSVQREALLWLAIIARSNIDFIYYLHEMQVFKTVALILQTKKPIAVRPALNCLIDCATTCMEHNDHNAHRLVESLITQHGLIIHTVDFSDQAGCEQITMRILQLWKLLLKWKFQSVRDALESVGGLDKLALLGSNNNPQLSAIWMEVDDIIHEREKMEIEFSEAQLDPATGNFSGGYAF